MFLPTKIILFAIFLSGTNIGAAFDQNHATFTSLLLTYVNPEGMVNYEGLSANRAPLDNYLKSTAAVTAFEFSSWDINNQIAFLVNVYNAETLQLVIDHYPVTSVKKIGSLFKSAREISSVQLFGSETTLDNIELNLLRENYSEERIHFALVYATLSGPPLRVEAYVGSELNRQLNEQAHRLMAQADKNRIEGQTLYLSPIFDWFEEDFTRDGKTISEYVTPFFPGGTKGKKIKFTNYNWNLNKQ
jgi:Protein of unknown function, DUF547